MQAAMQASAAAGEATADFSTSRSTVGELHVTRRCHAQKRGGHGDGPDNNFFNES